MKQITAEIPDEMETRINDAIVCGLAEDAGDLVRKALRFFLGGE